jgi:hypothetical protein
MKHLKRTICMTAVLCAVAAGTALPGGRIDTLTVIHVNDSHSNLTPYGAVSTRSALATTSSTWVPNSSAVLSPRHKSIQPSTSSAPTR